MAKKKRSDPLSQLIKDVEATADRLRAEIRKRATASGLSKNLHSIVNQLCQRAAAVAAQVEKRVHQIRKEIEGAGRKPAKRARRKKKPAAAPPQDQSLH